MYHWGRRGFDILLSTDSPQRQLCWANSTIWAIMTSASLTPSFVLKPCLNSCLYICIYTILRLRYGVSIDPNVLNLRILGTWLFRISAMKFLNHFWKMTKIGNRFPNPFTNFISLPLNKILQLSLNDSWIKDFYDFKFFLSFNFNWRRWYLRSAWYRWFLIWLK